MKFKIKRQGTLIRATRSPNEYGYWITHTGEMLEVNFQEHYDAAEKYVLKHNYKQYLQYLQQNQEADFTDFVRKFLGWIRLQVEGKTLNLDISENSLSQKSYNCLVKYIRENAYVLYLLDIDTDQGTKYTRYDTEDNRSALNKMLLVLKQNVDRSKHMQIEGRLDMQAILAKTQEYADKKAQCFSIKAKVHNTVLAAEARKRLVRYMRRQNEKKV